MRYEFGVITWLNNSEKKGEIIVKDDEIIIDSDIDDDELIHLIKRTLTGKNRPQEASDGRFYLTRIQSV